MFDEFFKLIGGGILITVVDAIVKACIYWIWHVYYTPLFIFLMRVCAVIIDGILRGGK